MNEERNNEIISAAKKHSDKLNSVLSFIQGATWADGHPNDEVLKLRKMFESDPDAYRLGYRVAIDKACEWLYKRQQVDLEVSNIKKFINDFKQAIGKQQ